MRITSISVLVLSVFVFAGAASAGNGNGNGNGNQGSAPGNSANAPGQVKKDDAEPPAAVTTTTTPAAPTTTTTDANATGVKPSNDTAHDTHAAAQSDKTKQYGHGQTAGQIAEKNGAAAKATLHGPGNSQPHKLAPCSGGHEVDAHALKSHRGRTCDGPEPSPTPTPHPHPNQQPNPGPPAATKTTTEHPPTKDPGEKPSAGGSSATSASGGHEGQSEGVAASAADAATLPFTGARLWIAVLAGLILIGTGLALREIRTAGAAVQSGHDHTDRSRHAARGLAASVRGRPGR